MREAPERRLDCLMRRQLGCTCKNICEALAVPIADANYATLFSKLPLCSLVQINGEKTALKYKKTSRRNNSTIVTFKRRRFFRPFGMNNRDVTEKLNKKVGRDAKKMLALITK